MLTWCFNAILQMHVVARPFQGRDRGAESPAPHKRKKEDLLAGYLGGAIASYTRIGEPYPVLVLLTTALLAWAELYLREKRFDPCSRSAERRFTTDLRLLNCGLFADLPL